MKKLYAFLLVAAVLTALPSTRASAQYFDHLALGLSVGVDGFGLELAAPIGNQFQMRAGYACLPPMWKPHAVFHLAPNRDREAVDVDIEAEVLFHNANLLFDWHPAGKGFFFTAGAYAGPGKVITLRNRNTFLDEVDWGTSGVVIDNTLVTSDDKGNVSIDLKVWPVRPYVGFGYGTPVRADKRVGFNVELGTCFTGGYKVYAKGKDLDTGDDGVVTRVTSASVNNEDKGIIDKMAKFPIIPMLKAGIFIRLF